MNERGEEAAPRALPQEARIQEKASPNRQEVEHIWQEVDQTPEARLTREARQHRQPRTKRAAG